LDAVAVFYGRRSGVRAIFIRPAQVQLERQISPLLMETGMNRE